jgi:hypothetical protein
MVLAASLATLAACSGWGLSGGSGKLTSVESGSTLGTSFTTRVYRGTEKNVADIFLSDLPETVWTQGGDVSDLSGSIVHIRMFISPQAGSTPIATTANTATVRWLILSKGRVGVYGGGGFFANSEEVGDKKLSGRLSGASLRLIQGGPGFADRLGPSLLSMSVDSVQNEETALAMSRAMESIVASSNSK